ncbi:MAG: pilus assembly protein TadG-related protein [Pseudomonadota bacterium]|nr:pilus assembly protein TadG-related protein [Pseudomonadota bacterium]
MTTLRRDVRGNTLAIMAAMLFPLAGLVGGGIDVARMYITKTRLQHACDAGALAGRKAMGGGTWAQNNNTPNTSAEQFFDANYKQGSYGSSSRVRTFTENAGKVTGNASVQLPMTLMKIFAVAPKTLAVTCSTDMRLPNTDIMFVLDTTGSMGDTPSGDSQSKMASLKVAVKCFYEIVARLDTNANCTTGTPGGGTGSAVQIRFGFVPYSTNVNVGRLLKPEWFANQWPYQSRAPRWWILQGNPAVTITPVSATNVPQSSCNDSAAAGAGYNSNADSYSNNNNTKTTTTVITHVTGWNAASGGTCSGTQTKTTSVYTRQENVAGGPNDQFIDYHYGQITQPVAALKNGSSWNSSFPLPLGTNGATKTIGWDGCIEERQTVRAASYTPIPSGAKDLDIDATPTTGDASSLWGPALPGMIFTRNGGAGWTQAESYTTNDYPNQSAYYCPVPATKLQAWPNAGSFESYVDTLTPSGNTYHDIGLLWGARLMSPTGLFASENALTPQGGEIQRNLIFMTDGDPCTGIGNYQAYGVAWFDRRQTDPNIAPTDGCTTSGTLTQQVNARTVALCSAIKNKNITLWVVTFGSVASSTVTRLTNCASPDRYFSASNAATLQATFASIANQISQLRIVQ